MVFGVGIFDTGYALAADSIKNAREAWESCGTECQQTVAFNNSDLLKHIGCFGIMLQGLHDMPYVKERITTSPSWEQPDVFKIQTTGAQVATSIFPSQDKEIVGTTYTPNASSVKGGTFNIEPDSDKKITLLLYPSDNLNRAWLEVASKVGDDGVLNLSDKLVNTANISRKTITPKTANWEDSCGIKDVGEIGRQGDQPYGDGHIYSDMTQEDLITKNPTLTVYEIVLDGAKGDYLKLGQGASEMKNNNFYLPDVFEAQMNGVKYAVLEDEYAINTTSEAVDGGNRMTSKLATETLAVDAITNLQPPPPSYYIWQLSKVEDSTTATNGEESTDDSTDDSSITPQGESTPENGEEETSVNPLWIGGGVLGVLGVGYYMWKMKQGSGEA